jgi:hypothetical protein
MALTRTEANSIQTQYYDKTLTQEVYEDLVFYKKLKAAGNVRWDGGNQIQFPIRYKQLNQTQAADPDAVIPYRKKDTRTSGVLDWKYITANNMITWDERVKNSGKAQIINLLKDKTEELSQDILEFFADQLFATTQAAASISSLNTIISASATYADIAVADISHWASTVDTTTTKLALYGDKSLSYMRNAATFGKNKPTMFLTTRDLWSYYEAQLEPQKRYYGDSKADGGFTSIYFHDTPIYSDTHVPAGYWYGLNMDAFEIRYHPDHDFKKTDWFTLEQSGLPEHMAKVVTWAGNLCCKSRRTQFLYTALDYTA